MSILMICMEGKREKLVDSLCRGIILKDYLILQFSEQRAQGKLVFHAESRERIVEFFDRKNFTMKSLILAQDER